MSRAVLGVPDRLRACLFYLGGVLTKTTKVRAALEEMFDAYLRERAARTGERFKPFDAVADYDKHVDGKPCTDGTRSFPMSIKNIQDRAEDGS